MVVSMKDTRMQVVEERDCSLLLWIPVRYFYQKLLLANTTKQLLRVSRVVAIFSCTTGQGRRTDERATKPSSTAVLVAGNTKEEQLESNVILMTFPGVCPNTIGSVVNLSNSSRTGRCKSQTGKENF
eukprot:scaffold5383_cov222-Amphora_coffeaeformis.AAC.16